MNNEQCKDCIHRDVCAYKEHYEDVVELYKKASEEASKYPWFSFSIHCIKYDIEKPYTLRNAELPSHTNSLQLTQKMPKPYKPIDVILLERIKKAREEIDDLDRYFDNDLYTDNTDSMFKCDEVLEILDKLIAESEG